MNSLLQTVIFIVGFINIMMSVVIVFRIRQPASPALWIVKAVPTSLATVLAFVGMFIMVFGLLLSSPMVTIVGGVSALTYVIHIVLVTRSPGSETGFEQAFGKSWENSISRSYRDHFLTSRMVFLLPEGEDPMVERDIVFYTIPESQRQLLCDVWQPPENTERSGLAFIYLFGSAWKILDKDAGTRTFFRYLTNQGHVIMDVAYRLFPETDMMGMVYDAKHAIAWMKAKASTYRIDPARIVLGGGSAGAHISMLAAFTNKKEQFIPADLAGTDLSLRGLISIYGPTDLEVLYYQTAQHITTRGAPKKSGSSAIPAWMKKKMGKEYYRFGLDKMENSDQKFQPGILPPMLGGHPHEKPEVYSLYSPITHVHSGCPPTLIIQGEHDLITSPKATRAFFKKMKEAGVPVVMHMLPQVDHGFDLFLPKISPSAHVAYYDIERFLALCSI
jgi:acetyl esterase/lipase